LKLDDLQSCGGNPEISGMHLKILDETVDEVRIKVLILRKRISQRKIFTQVDSGQTHIDFMRHLGLITIMELSGYDYKRSLGMIKKDSGYDYISLNDYISL
jgi:hypothetical protein